MGKPNDLNISVAERLSMKDQGHCAKLIDKFNKKWSLFEGFTKKTASLIKELQKELKVHSVSYRTKKKGSFSKSQLLFITSNLILLLITA